MANPKLLLTLFKLWFILVEVTRSQWVKFGVRKNPEARPYFVYMLLGTLLITFIVVVLKE